MSTRGCVIKDLYVAYDDTVILNYLNLSFPLVGCIGITGPSGCGKTTLLNAIAGIKDFEGKIIIYDENGNLPKIDIVEKQKRIAPEKGVSYVFQEDRLLPWFSAKKNVQLVIKGNFAEKKAEDLLFMVGLENDMDKLPEEMSGGMKGRVNIARALGYGGRVLLLDEPFKGLDDKVKAKIKVILKEISKEKLIILVTHDNQDLDDLAQEVIELNQSTY